MEYNQVIFFGEIVLTFLFPAIGIGMLVFALLPEKRRPEPMPKRLILENMNRLNRFN